jgi:hypothetical protein
MKFKPHMLANMFNKKTSKYRNEKFNYYGKTFDSKKEARRYLELRSMEKAREISCIECQPEFVLQDKFKLNGKTYRAIMYKADFKYIDKDNNIVVEDVKGFKTPVYQIKKKMFLNKFGDRFIFKET